MRGLVGALPPTEADQSRAGTPVQLQAGTPGLVRFSLALLRLQRSRAAELPLSEPPAPEEVQRCLAEGVPLLDISRPGGSVPGPGEDEIAAMVAEIAELAAQHHLSGASAAEEVAKQLARDATPRDRGSKEPDAEVLQTLREQAVRPWLLRYAQAAAGVDWSDWRRGYCPVCGAQAGIARLDDGGRRHLACTVCGTEWPYARIGCPSCGQTEGDKLRYIWVEGDDAHRVLICDDCGGYLKTVDERLFDKSDSAAYRVDPTAVDAETLELDALAQARGAVRGGRAS